MPKKRVSDLFFSAARRAAGRTASATPPPDLATLKKSVRSPFLPSSSRPTYSRVSKPQRVSTAVTSQVIARLQRASAPQTPEDSSQESGEQHSAVEISREISSILRGSNDAMDSPYSLEANDRVMPNNILDIPWFSNTPDTCTTHRKKEMSRERKQKYIFKNTESRRFTKLMRMCADKLGTESTVEIFGKLGRETGMKEYTALIKLSIGKARSARLNNDEKESLVQIHKAYQLLESMIERGFQIEEESFSPFLTYMIDMGMVEEFHIFCRLIIDQNPASHSRIGYYEMLLWIRVGDEDKIRELCNSIGVTSGEDNFYLAESYLLAFCESDRKDELLQLLEVLDISRISSFKYISSIFKSLGRLQLDSFMEKYIFALKTTGAPSEKVSTLIYDYAVSIPNLVVEEVVSIFNNLHEKLRLVPSVASYEKLVTLCCNLFKVHTALDVVDCMCQHGLDVPIETFQTLLQASEQSCEPDMVRPIYSVMRRHNVKPKGDTFKIMISLCMKIKDFEGAYNLLADVAEMNEMPTTSMYNAIMAGYFREKNVHRALMVLKQMECADVKPDSETFSYLISNCQCEEDIVKYLNEMEHAGVQPTKYVYMALINAYANFGNFEMARQVLLDQKLPVKFLNEIKSVLISALSSNGQIVDALVLYDEIKKAGCSLEPKAAICLIENLRSEGELDRLLQLLEELKDSKYWFDGCSRVVVYCVQYSLTESAVELLKQLKNKDTPSTYMVIDQIFSLIWKMEPTNLKMGLKLLRAVKVLDLHPSRTSLDFLISACVKAKDPQRAWAIWSEYDKAGLSYNILTFLRMYQVLLASGEHKAASKMLNRMPQDDPHVRQIIKSCKMTFHKRLSVED